MIIHVNEKNPRGPGIWKLNTSILKLKQFQKIFYSFWKFWQNKKREYTNYNDWWNAGKLYLKLITIDFCTQRNKQIQKQIQKLAQYIFQEKSKINPNTDEINKCQQELDEIENYRNEGTFIRSKEKIILNEEKPTKFFYSLEKQKQKKKIVTKIKDENDKTLTKSTEILNERTNFYQKLYNKK